MRTTNPLEDKILALTEPLAAELGLEVVRVRLSGVKRKRLQIMAERQADGLMAVENCEALSRALSAVLDVTDPIQGEYDLEVSSPGIDRPLVRLNDFVRFAGHEAKIELSLPLDGQRRFRGTLNGIAGEAVLLTTETGPVSLSFAALNTARLVLTDKLIEEDLRRAKAARAAAGLDLADLDAPDVGEDPPLLDLPTNAPADPAAPTAPRKKGKKP